MARRSLVLVLFLATPACTERDAPKPVPVPDSDAAAPAVAVDPDDPAEPGIPDLARLARYVYKAMQRHEQVCPFANPFRDRLHFALTVEVEGGRMTRVGLGHAGLEAEGASEPRPLARAHWPRELTGYVGCLAPHLRAVTMAPAPSDGSYEPAYSYGGRPDGRPAPP